MPKSHAEVNAITLAKKHWRIYAGCACDPVDVPEGKGYDLECKHKHVEVKGTEGAHCGFRTLTAGEFDAARKDMRFEMWLISGIKGIHGVFHVIAGRDIMETAKAVTHWHLPLGKARLEKYRAAALKRKKGTLRGSVGTQGQA